MFPKRASSNSMFWQCFRQYGSGQWNSAVCAWRQVCKHNRRQEFNNCKRKRIHPTTTTTTTGMSGGAGRVVALHKKEERRRGAWRERRRDLSSSSSYVGTDDGTTLPRDTEFFVKMQSAQQPGRHESRQEARQRVRIADPESGPSQDCLVFGALSS